MSERWIYLMGYGLSGAMMYQAGKHHENTLALLVFGLIAAVIAAAVFVAEDEK